MPSRWTSSLDDPIRAIGVRSGPQMPQFRGDARPAGVDPAADDQRPADAGSDVRVQNDLAAASSPDPRLGQAGHFGVVGRGGRQAERPAAPVQQGKSVPAGHMIASDDLAGRPIDGATETDSNGLNVISCRKRRPEAFDRAADALGAVGRTDIDPFDGCKRAVVGRADADLQFRAADFMPRNIAMPAMYDVFSQSTRGVAPVAR